ncbi:DNA-directed RNA polymerase subunit beta' [bacterium HR19]|nr:DNA-directed RNA polymerase subunit beta' [bacterium HR19]
MEVGYESKIGINDIEAIRISIASPEKISSMAHGEVERPDTINYRTGKPERGGLFCAVIFGPINDWECLCGKYKGQRYRGHVCERCGVEVTSKRVRRERMGKKTLAYPVVHVWFLKIAPNPIPTLLDISQREVEEVISFNSWIIVEPPEKAYQLTISQEDIEKLISQLKEYSPLKREHEFLKKYSAHIEQLRGVEEVIKEMALRRILISAAFDKEICNKKDPEQLCSTVLKNLKKFEKFKKAEEIISLMQELLDKLKVIDYKEKEARFKSIRRQIILSAIRFPEYAIVEREVIALLAKNWPEIFLPMTILGGIGGDAIKSFDEKNIDVERESFGKDQFAVVYHKKTTKGPVKLEVQNMVVGSGAEVIRYLLKKIDLSVLEEIIKIDIEEESQKRKGEEEEETSRVVKLSRRLRIVKQFKNSKNRPEWMVLEVLPILPPELRPIVQLEGGRIARSDLNEFYRTIIQRNNRLVKMKKLIELGIGVPDAVIENEIRLLQSAVDSLIDSSKTRRQVTSRTGRTYRSLADIIKGKYGRFRQNLLGKRTDFSARSVIVVGPDLKLHQVGIPKEIALELFKPFIIWWLIKKKGIVSSVKEARKIFEERKYAAMSGKIDDFTRAIFLALEDVIKEKLVLLNRAPTLHRMNVQSFEIVLTEGKAIRLHPLVCTAYNADFDGDQMGVFLPLSLQVQVEARVLMLSTHQILSPAHGNPIVYPTQDQVMGIFWMTMDRLGEKGEGKVFSSAREVYIAYENKEISIHARIKCLITCLCDEHKGVPKLYDTTPGRVIFYQDILPKKLCFNLVNKPLGKKELIELVALSREIAGEKETVIFLDKMKDIGFEMLTKSGFTLTPEHFIIPEEKEKLISEAEKLVKEIEDKYTRRLITWGERYNRITQIWLDYTEKVGQLVKEKISWEEVKVNGKTEKIFSKNPVFLMVHSGSRGSYEQIKQLAGMRGIVAKPTGELIEFPIKHNLREGLTPLEYFISTHGGRKGLADTALKTAKAGYLTRKLVDVSQDIVVKMEDCGTKKSITISALTHGGEVLRSLSQRIFGRVAAEDIISPDTGEVIVAKGEYITREKAKLIEELGIESVRIRSVLVCEAEEGVCQKCYGWDLSSHKPVTLGEAVGIIAAQSIGEPGTQLTMRTFHYGGIAALSERGEVIAHHDGEIKITNTKLIELEISQEEMEKFGVSKDELINGKYVLRVISRSGTLDIVSPEKGRTLEKYELVYGAIILARHGDKVKRGKRVVVWNPYANLILTHVSGTVSFRDIIPGVTVIEKKEETTGKVVRTIVEPIGEAAAKLRPAIVIKTQEGKEIAYSLPVKATISVEQGQKVKAGEEIARVETGFAKTKDITTGLPKVEEFFEARNPKDAAIISEITGRVEKIEDMRGGRKKVVIKSGKIQREYIVPKNRHVIQVVGDVVNAGEAITDGTPNPKNLLKIRGPDYVGLFLLNEIQKVYSSQGIDINDKHFEIIIRQMLRRVKIKKPGDTEFIPGEIVDRFLVEKKNREIRAKGGKPATYEYTLLGITRSALYSDSWISAASFQETPKVLVSSALESKIDYLKGIKENIIVGKLIPAGTNFHLYRNTGIETERQTITEELVEEELRRT